VPDIQVTDEVYERITAYAHRWGQTEGQVVDTLVRLFVEPVHTVAPPPAPTAADADPTDSADPGETTP
jgi:hypothetical protein